MTTNKKILEKLDLFKNYDCDDETKIKFIENLYIIANISFDNYIKKIDKIKP